jgi:hypothetical protein
MKHRLVFILTGLILCLAGSIPAHSQNNPFDANDAATPSVTPTPANTPAPAATPEMLHLKDKFAIGTDTLRLDENFTGYGSTPNSNAFSAVDAIWWFSDNEALDILATVSTVSSVGADFNGNAYGYPTQIFAGGLGYRWNISSPVRDLKIQGLARITYGHYTNQQEAWYYGPANISFEETAVNSESFNLIGGLGFEYFLPFCESFSVQSYLAFAASYNDNEGSVLYNPNMPKYGYTGYVNSGYHTGYWRTALLLNGLSLSSVAIHFYF